MISLRYRGDGAYRPDLPARDMDVVEIETIAAARKTDVASILEEARGSGLYELIDFGGDPELEDAPAAEPVEDKALEDMNRDEVRAACADLGVSQAGSKAEMIERIRAKLAEDAPAAEPEPEVETDQDEVE